MKKQMKRMVTVGMAAVMMSMPVMVFAEETDADIEIQQSEVYDTASYVISDDSYEYMVDEFTDLFNFGADYIEAENEESYSMIEDNKISENHILICNSSDAVLRAKARNNSEIVAKLKKGDKLIYISKEDSFWLRVKCGNTIGYIQKKYVG